MTEIVEGGGGLGFGSWTALAISPWSVKGFSSTASWWRSDSSFFAPFFALVQLEVWFPLVFGPLSPLVDSFPTNRVKSVQKFPIFVIWFLLVFGPLLLFVDSFPTNSIKSVMNMKFPIFIRMDQIRVFDFCWFWVHYRHWWIAFLQIE